MNRQESEEMAKGPGKFEGEPIYAPYFWDMAMNGMDDDTEWDDDTPISVFTVTEEDRALFPELDDAKTVRLWEDGNGFVYVESY